MEIRKLVARKGFNMRVAVAGAGLSGAVIARELANNGHDVEVFEARNHVAGNCYTKRDPEGTGVMLHAYGPHIFHTDNARAWNYVRSFDEFVPYRHRGYGVVQGQVYSLPINLHTINQFFGDSMSPTEAKIFVTSQCRLYEKPRNFEEQALSTIGPDLYEAFFKSYTIKQWGRDPIELPPSIFTRLPLRFNYDDSYFAHRFQGLPRHGYTEVVEGMLEGVPVHLDAPLQQRDVSRYDHVFYTGPLDAFFLYCHGRLAYRTLDFKSEVVAGDGLGTPVLNYCDATVPYTRRTEHKHFMPWEPHDKSVIFTEFSRECTPDDEPYYPIRLAHDKEQLAKYAELVANEPRVTFVGRLGRYQYLDMDVTVAEALAVADKFLGREHD